MIKLNLVRFFKWFIFKFAKILCSSILVQWCFQKMKEKPENGEDFFKFVDLLSEKSENWKLSEICKT